MSFLFDANAKLRLSYQTLILQSHHSEHSLGERKWLINVGLKTLNRASPVGELAAPIVQVWRQNGITQNNQLDICGATLSSHLFELWSLRHHGPGPVHWQGITCLLIRIPPQYSKWVSAFPLICSLVTQKFRILKLCFLSIEDERGGTIIIDTTRFAKLTLHSTWKSATTSRTTQRSRSGCKSTSLHCSRTTECFRPSRPLCTPSLPGLGRTSTAGRCS